MSSEKTQATYDCEACGLHLVAPPDDDDWFREAIVEHESMHESEPPSIELCGCESEPHTCEDERDIEINRLRADLARYTGEELLCGGCDSPYEAHLAGDRGGCSGDFPEWFMRLRAQVRSLERERDALTAKLEGAWSSLADDLGMTEDDDEGAVRKEVRRLRDLVPHLTDRLLEEEERLERAEDERDKARRGCQRLNAELTLATERAEQAERERDEARAEIEQVKLAIAEEVCATPFPVSVSSLGEEMFAEMEREHRDRDAATPVCATCNDTHQMPLGEDDDRRLVMCTRCPTPCQRCRAGGNGPYCERAPCACACHGSNGGIAP